MSTIRRTLLAVAAVPTLLLLAGCSDLYPKPDKDALYYFLANARLHGKVRVCWPAGQEYAISVTKADAELQGLLGALAAVGEAGNAWDRDDPRWWNARAVEQRLGELRELVEADAAKRQAAFDALAAALQNVPKEDLALSDDAARDEYIDRLWKALAVEGESLEEHMHRLEEFAAARLRVFEIASECYESLDEAADEARFTDDSCNMRFDAAWLEFSQKANDLRGRFVSFARDTYTELKPELAEIDKQKERDRYNYLDSQRQFVKNTLEVQERGLRELIRADEKAIKQLEAMQSDPAPDHARKLAFYKRRLTRLQNEVAKQKETAEEIKAILK